MHIFLQFQHFNTLKKQKLLYSQSFHFVNLICFITVYTGQLLLHSTQLSAHVTCDSELLLSHKCYRDLLQSV